MFKQLQKSQKVPLSHMLLFAALFTIFFGLMLAFMRVHEAKIEAILVGGLPPFLGLFFLRQGRAVMIALTLALGLSVALVYATRNNFFISLPAATLASSLFAAAVYLRWNVFKQQSP